MTTLDQNTVDFDEPDYSESIFIDNSEMTESLTSLDRLGDTFTGVPGRLLGKSAFYIEVEASQYIIDTVSSGYQLIFKNNQPPPVFYKRNNKSALDKGDFIYQELKRLESLGCIKSVTSPPHVINPVSCVFSKKWRVVLDASIGLNPFCLKRKITLDDLRSIHKVLKKGDFMTVSDLDSGYWHVPIHASH